ncbi:MAG TPA: hypothetical protein VLV88_05075 [Terriglobales bacterium]|nr:hypothetical protein [Terriglobales bacterium]
MRISKILAVFLSICLAVPLVVLPDEPPDAHLKTVAVAAFKNGLSFVIRQGDVQLENSTGRISAIPEATLGTLWIAPNEPGTSLEEVIAYRYKVSGERSLTSLASVLLANAGKTVTVNYNNKEFTGEIVGLRESEMPAPEPQPLSFSEGQPGYSFSSNPPAHAAPEYLLLKSEGKLLALHLSAIQEAYLPSDAVLQEKQEEERRAMRFKIKGAGSHTGLTMGYLEHGLGWTPSYMISLQDDNTAKITMQAVLTDDAEDLNGADVFFVVGVPNFSYSSTLSPMAMQETLLQFMKDAESRDARRNSLYSNAIAGQLVADEVSIASAPSFATTVAELSGAPEEDLFLYTRSGVTLARGERAMFNVFSGDVSYEHIYEWEVQDQTRVDGFGNVVQPNYNANSPDTANVNNIWHCIRLKNSTKFPWTSAPAMVISGTRPISQDTLPYTPKAAGSDLKITIATDIRSTHEEREIARQQNVERRRGYNYDLVTVEGTLKAKNYKSKEVRLKIGKTLRGEVESQTDGGKAVKLGEAIQTDNPMSRLTWEITLKPEEARTITYRYKIWVRV